LSKAFAHARQGYQLPFTSLALTSLNHQRLSSKRFTASWLVGCSPVPKLPKWKHCPRFAKHAPYALLNNTPKLGDVTAQRNEELTPAEKEGD